MSILIATLLALQTAMPPIGQRTVPLDRMPTGAALIPDADQDPVIAAASAFPLGSAENPVRVGGPEGERAYLARLRCANGGAPEIGARTERGVGAFGSMVASYRLSCPNALPVELVIDMYHEEHREDRAPPGLAIEAR